MKKCVYLRLARYERYNRLLGNLVNRRFLDLAVVPVLVLKEDIEGRCFSLTVNIRKGMCDTSEDELFRTACKNTVEGNSGDACRQRSYPVGSSSIYGYGIPAY